KLAQTSPPQVVQELQERYPGYASFFTEERIAGIVQAIAQQSFREETPGKQDDNHGEHHRRPARQQEPGYDPQQHTHRELSNNLRATQDGDATRSLESESMQ